jgi:hypothetical protein
VQPTAVTMAYPYFECIVCHNRVQKVVDVTDGFVPAIVMLRPETPLSALFDDAGVSELHCRGQGSRYNHKKRFDGSDEDLHFNFSGCFIGMCCFCACHSGFGTELFLCNGCSHCVRKDILRLGFTRPFSRVDGVETSWESHGWRALPMVLVDHILSFVVGVQGDGLARIEDGCVLVRGSGSD